MRNRNWAFHSHNTESHRQNRKLPRTGRHTGSHSPTRRSIVSITAAEMRKSESCRRENAPFAEEIRPRDLAIPITAAVPATRNPCSFATARPARSSIRSRASSPPDKAMRMQADSPSSRSGKSGLSGVAAGQTRKNPAATAAPIACSSPAPDPDNTSRRTSSGIHTTPNKAPSHVKPSSRARPINGLASVRTRRAIRPASPYPVPPLPPPT